MFNKVKQAGQMLEAQKKFNELKKQLETVTAEAQEGEAKVGLKGAIAMYELDTIEINGVDVTSQVKKAIKKANKDMNKKLRKKFKSGEIDMSAMGGM